jgi:branched-chain amino acid transport system substrate-binding protein
VLSEGKEPNGTNMRQALIDIKTFDLPLTNRVVFADDHTVDKPVYYWQVKNGKFQLIGKSK